MKINQNKTITSRIDFFYYMFRNILLVSLPLLAISGLVLSLSHSSATDNSSGSGSTDSFTVSISSACTISGVVNSIHNIETNVGTYVADVGKTTIKTLCNDGNGYAIYANGYSNNEEGNNKLINSGYPQYSIDTGLATGGLTSTWAMKLNNIENDPSPTPPTIESDYNDVYGIVPPYWTKVAGRASGTTDMAEGSSFTTTYAVYASSSQYAGTYSGQVKYLLTHPSLDAKHFFMQNVAEWKDQMIPHEGDSIQAVDERDGKSYWVTKLKDGNIWMTQNLDFDLDNTKTLSSLDTDLNVAYNSTTGQYAEYNSGYSQVNDVIYWQPLRSTISFEGAHVTGWGNSNMEPYSASKTDNINIGHASLGNYYNWTAAIASNNSNALTSNTLNDILQNPQNSICPKGWRLPTISSQSETIIGSTNEFARLNYLYNNNYTNSGAAWFNEPLYFVAGGVIDNYNGNLASIGESGLYYSSTISSSQHSYRMVIAMNSVSLADGGNWSIRGRGNSVRCVAR